MKIITNLIRQHKSLFFVALFFTFLTALINLYWNNFLADMINSLENVLEGSLKPFLIPAVIIILLHTFIEYLASYLASYTCEVIAHEMRMGYARFYLQSNIQTLSKLNAGEEQSAMQNELSEISMYLNENLFSLARQFVSFGVTVVFLFCINAKLTSFLVFQERPYDCMKRRESSGRWRWMPRTDIVITVQNRYSN